MSPLRETPATDEPDRPKWRAKLSACSAHARRDDFRIGREDPHELFAEDVHDTPPMPSQAAPSAARSSMPFAVRKTRSDALTDQRGCGNREATPGKNAVDSAVKRSAARRAPVSR